MTTGKQALLANQIKQAIDKADKDRKTHRRMAHLIRLAVILSTAAVPILLGVRVSEDATITLTNAAIVLGALATA